MATEQVTLRTTIQTIVDEMERIAPLSLAEGWDNVGLLIGDRQSPVQKIITCLTITREVVQEAVREGVQMIITHHPILFKPVKQLVMDRPESRMVCEMIQKGIAVYSAHTAFDNSVGGINDWLAQKLELVDTRALRPRAGEMKVKLVVYVPVSDLNKVADAIFAAGAGVIGEYKECSFRLAGVGTFYGSEQSNPSLGQKGRREEVQEYRLEAVVPQSNLQAVVQAMRLVHSYEEPAFDVYPLQTVTSPSIGAGRIGRLPEKRSLESLALHLGKVLKAPGVQLVGDRQQSVQEIAIACGAAGEFLSDAIRAKADVFVTGEMRFHDLLLAKESRVGVVLPGHYASEHPAMMALADRLQEKFPDLIIRPSYEECEPISILPIL